MPSRRAFPLAPIARPRAVPIAKASPSPPPARPFAPDCYPPRAMSGLEKILELVLAVIGAVAVLTVLALAL